MTDLALSCTVPIEAVRPHAMPDLFAGDEVVVVGRYPKAGVCAFTLRGRVRGKTVEHVFEGTLPDTEGIACLPGFWAQQEIDALLAAVAAGGNRAELVPAIRKLATRYSIVTKYTAGLVLEPGGEVVQPDTTVRRNPRIGRGGGGADVIEEAPIETEEVDDHNEVDTDSEFEEIIGKRGMSDIPFTGPSTNSAIGLGGGAGGAFRGRFFQARRHARDTMGIARGLLWLAGRQAEDGSIGDVSETAGALLAFFGAGYTDRGSESDNPHSKTVRNAIRFLMNRQGKDARIGKDLRSHIRATTALCEAYSMTRNPRYKRPAQRALDYLSLERARYLAWPSAKPDTLTTAAAVVAIKTGRFAGLDIDPDSFEGARLWLTRKEAVSNDTEAAAAHVARVLLGESPFDSAGLKALERRIAGAKLGSAAQTEWVALALHQVGGGSWSDWNAAVQKALAGKQQKDGSYGSIDATAAACRIQLAPYRLGRAFKRR
jgi:hypothetical protein